MGRAETYRILYPNLDEGFANLFDEEIDSWFAADVACCSKCYDEFCSKWPLVYLRDTDFQQAGIELFPSFYSGSCMSQLFSADHFKTLIQELECARCGAPLKDVIWPYSFKFRVPDRFEEVIEEIGRIAIRTPFLVLQHSFAKQVLDQIKEIGARLPSTLPDPHFRARRCRDLGSRFPSLADFLPPPPCKTTEGRYNHAGSPALYLATDSRTCFLELGSPTDGIHSAHVRFMRPLKILDLLSPSLQNDALIAALNSSLLSAPHEHEGWHQPQYFFPRFLADCAIASGIDAIKYPCVRAARGDNLAVLGICGVWNEVVEISDIEFYSAPAQNVSSAVWRAKRT